MAWAGRGCEGPEWAPLLGMKMSRNEEEGMAALHHALCQMPLSCVL